MAMAPIFVQFILLLFVPIFADCIDLSEPTTPLEQPTV